MEGAATMTAEERLVETVGRVLPDYGVGGAMLSYSDKQARSC
jgi:hypothetical protein